MWIGISLFLLVMKVVSLVIALCALLDMASSPIQVALSCITVALMVDSLRTLVYDYIQKEV